MSRRRRHFETNPHTGTCDLCGDTLAIGALIRRRGRWLHRDCWTREKGE